MKLFVSSKVLTKKLSELDFDTYPVTRVTLQKGTLSLTAGNKTVRIRVLSMPIKNAGVFENHSARWDWVYELLKNCSEQPIVLNIYKTMVEVIFQY